MAILTPLALDDARALGREFGLEVTSVRGIPAGSVNSNYELSLASGARAFLRVYEEQAADAARAEAAMLDHLAAGGVLTPRPLRLVARAGGTESESALSDFVSSHAGKAVAVFPWVDGEVACQGRVTAARAARVGAALARVHLAGAGWHAVPGRFGSERLAARLEGLPASARTGELGAAVSHLAARLRTARPSPARGLIHGDLFRDNVLWASGPGADDDDLRGLLDFESASAGSFAFDLMVTLLAWCFGDRLEPALAHALVDGYRAVRELEPADLAVLYGDGCFAAVRFAITRITDFELRPRGAGVYKDYRRFLARLDALDALGEHGLAELCGVARPA